MVMKFFPHVQNCGPSIKMPKNQKNNFGNIFKIFSENCWNIFRKSAKRGRKTPIFEKYFKNVPKIIFSIFWHFYTRPAILYVWKKFHNHSFFPSYFFHHLKIGGRWHISYWLSVLGKASHIEIIKKSQFSKSHDIFYYFRQRFGLQILFQVIFLTKLGDRLVSPRANYWWMMTQWKKGGSKWYINNNNNINKWEW